MFYQLFHSASEYSAHDRKWMLRVLSEGLHTELDYEVVRRRHVLSLLMAFASSTAAGVDSRRTVLVILGQATNGNDHTLLDCVEHCGVTSWLAQLVCDAGASWALRARAVCLLRSIVHRLGTRMARECADLARNLLAHSAANLVHQRAAAGQQKDAISRAERMHANHFCLALLDLVRSVAGHNVDSSLRDAAVEEFIEAHLPLQRHNTLNLAFWRIQNATV
jgi:Nucleolar pre-ribosomal-associated protein 1